MMESLKLGLWPTVGDLTLGKMIAGGGTFALLVGQGTLSMITSTDNGSTTSAQPYTSFFFTH